MERPVCPRCDKDFTRRARRRSAWEHALSLLYAYPFRCQLCTHRFVRFQWGAKYTRGTPDQREYCRVLVSMPVLFSRGREETSGMIVNLSMRGCALESSEPLQSGEILSLNMKGGNGFPPITIEAAVVRCCQKQRAALEFLRMQSGERASIRRVIEPLLREQPG